MLDGVIVKGIAGFYYVKAEDRIYECKARGKFKNKKVIPLVGDYVTISIDPENEEKGVIEKIKKREVELFRPAVANVDQAVIVFALKDPDPHINLLDKLLVLVERSRLDIVICFNKADIDDESYINELKAIYEPIGYKVIESSAKEEHGIDSLREILKDKITVFAGPSGVGKSSLLNAIKPGLELKTGEVSAKIGRGKHTTRHSELIALDFGGYVVDTPGFTSLDVEVIEPEELSWLFPEMKDFSEDCQFNDCLHLKEPNCGVKAAVESGKINPKRYESYLYFMDEIKECRRKKSW